MPELLTPAENTAELRVAVTTALGALPLEGASVTVSTIANKRGERTLLYTVETDSNGITPSMTLDTPPRANSLTPGGGLPYSLYTVEISQPGYTPVTALRIYMFAGIPAILPVALTPLPENAPTGETDLTATGDAETLTSPGYLLEEGNP